MFHILMNHIFKLQRTQQRPIYQFVNCLVVMVIVGRDYRKLATWTCLIVVTVLFPRRLMEICSRHSLRRCQDLHRRFQTTSSCVQCHKHFLSWKCSVDSPYQLLLFCFWALGRRGTLLQTEVSSHLFVFRTSQLPIWVEDFEWRFAVKFQKVQSAPRMTDPLAFPWEASNDFLLLTACFRIH